MAVIVLPLVIDRTKIPEEVLILLGGIVVVFGNLEQYCRTIAIHRFPKSYSENKLDLIHKLSLGSLLHGDKVFKGLFHFCKSKRYKRDFPNQLKPILDTINKYNNERNAVIHRAIAYKDGNFLIYRAKHLDNKGKNGSLSSLVPDDLKKLLENTEKIFPVLEEITFKISTRYRSKKK